MQHSRLPIVGQRYYQSQDMGKWLKSFAWDWFIHLTLKVYMTPAQLEWRYKGFLGRFGKKIGYFYAIERTNPLAAPHIHSLVVGTDDIRFYYSVIAWWKDNGFAVIERYNPQEDGCFYCVKNIATRRLINWDIGGSLRQPASVQKNGGGEQYVINWE